MPKNARQRHVLYTLDLEDGRALCYEFIFDESYRLRPPEAAEVKAWTRLTCHQCPHCPLTESNHPQCPIARNLDGIVEDSKNALCSSKARVAVEAGHRRYHLDCDTRQALRSLFGLIMSTSGCPHLDWLRPLARFHLPLADIDETLFRILSLQLVELYLTGDPAALAQASEIIQTRYAAVEAVNRSFISRLQAYCRADAGKRALEALGIYAQLFTLHVQSNFAPLQKYFRQAPHGERT